MDNKYLVDSSKNYSRFYLTEFVLKKTTIFLVELIFFLNARGLR